MAYFVVPEGMDPIALAEGFFPSDGSELPVVLPGAGRQGRRRRSVGPVPHLAEIPVGLKGQTLQVQSLDSMFGTWPGSHVNERMVPFQVEVRKTNAR